ncbi:MAG: hypothetical protein JST64_10640 [Actinobacteria bacterium]|nr:hypothetical protein [Actinomycetota bacterium]
MWHVLLAAVVSGDGLRRPEAGASLEEATKLPGDVPEGRALVSIWPECDEAVVIGMAERAFQAPSDRGSGPSEEFLAQQDPNGEQRNARSAQEAARRARREILRFCVANRLQFMWTLTFAESVWDVDEARRAVAALIEQLRELFGGPFPYLYVFELHPGGHGLHVHLAVPRYIPHDGVAEGWGRGHVWVTGPKRRGLAAAVAARSAARYLAKYVDKAIEEGHSFGRHRYERAQGFAPKRVRLRRWDIADGIRYVIERFGRQPSYVWKSSSDPGWLGPPCCKMWFDPVAPDG